MGICAIFFPHLLFIFIQIIIPGYQKGYTIKLSGIFKFYIIKDNYFTEKMSTCTCIQVDMILQFCIEKLFEYSEGNHKGNFKIMSNFRCNIFVVF